MAESAPPPVASKDQSSTPAQTPEQHRSIGPFAVLSLVSFLAGMILLWILVFHAELLVRLGLVGQIYYVVLIPLGLAAAGSLFGILRSYAVYRGQVLGGVLELLMVAEDSDILALFV